MDRSLPRALPRPRRPGHPGGAAIEAGQCCLRRCSARARGLGTHLLHARGRYSCTSRPFGAPRAGHAREPLSLRGPPDAALVERAVRRTPAQRLAMLGRWCGERAGLLEIFFGERTGGTCGALVRGAAAAAPPRTGSRGRCPRRRCPSARWRRWPRQPQRRRGRPRCCWRGGTRPPPRWRETRGGARELLRLERSADPSVCPPSPGGRALVAMRTSDGTSSRS